MTNSVSRVQWSNLQSNSAGRQQQELTLALPSSAGSGWRPPPDRNFAEEGSPSPIRHGEQANQPRSLIARLKNHRLSLRARDHTSEVAELMIWSLVDET